MTGFLSRYKTAVAGKPCARFVFLANFEVEERWAVGEVGLPRQFASGAAVARRMDEFAVCLAGPGDHVLLTSPPDSGYLEWLEGLDIPLPTQHVVRGSDTERSVTEGALGDPDLLRTLEALAAGGVLLAPHGVSDLEERLSTASAMPLAAPPAHVCKAVNSKVYSRQLADKLGLRQPPGRACTSVEELEDAVRWGVSQLAAGRTVVLKDAFGMAGRGIVIVTPADGAHRLERLCSIVGRAARRASDRMLGLVLEEWVPTSMDLNCQVLLSREGSAQVDHVKEMVVEAGAMRGHRIPARLTAAQAAELADAAAAIAQHLGIEGYYGVVGIDAMIDAEGGLYPLVEINARNNMSTYQSALQDRFMPGAECAIARWYPMPPERLSFAALRSRLGDALYDPARRTGLLVNNFQTADAGRLYGLVIGRTDAEVAALDAQVSDRLTTTRVPRSLVSSAHNWSFDGLSHSGGQD
jgi:hypothetical protein